MRISTRMHVTRRFVDAYCRFVEPRVSGLPNWRVVVIFPAVVTLGTVVLIAFGISGTSSGAHWYNLGSGADPRLLYGVPRMIRSDEWLVQQGWVVSQFHHGWPAVNQIFPGGVDMTVLNELPSWDWSSMFRPHLWGYLFLGLDTGVAWAWWLPALALVVASFLFLVTWLPRHLMTSATVAVAVFFTPLLQWFYGPSTLWPVAWGLLASAGVVWILRDRRRWVRYLWAGGVGYLAVTMAMGLYIPYIIPALLVFLFVTVGVLFRDKPWRGRSLTGVVSLIGPYLVAGATASVVTLGWAVVHLTTFDAISSTVYPGQRVIRVGSLLSVDPNLLGFAGAPWNAVLKANSGQTALGDNSSESATVLLIAVFLLPALIWFAIASFRRTVSTDWLAISVIACMALIGADLFIPGWDAVARIFQFDKVPPDRFRIALVLLIPVTIAIVVERAERLSLTAAIILGGVCASFTGALMIPLWLTLRWLDPVTLAMSPSWKAVIVLLAVTVFALLLRRIRAIGAIALLLATGLIGWNINPVYLGVYDLSQNATGKAIKKLDAAAPGEWVGVGSYETMAQLVETGVSSFSGVQTYPSTKMWLAIDPASEYRQEWDRLAHIHWQIGIGAPKLSNPTPDVILVTIDPCSFFAQKHVDYLLTDQGQQSSACLSPKKVIKQGALTMRIYEVVPSSKQ